jgi:hypothetical protein
MKAFYAALFLVLVIPSAFTQRNRNEPVGDAPDRKAVEGFGGHLTVVEDPRSFIQEWLKPDTPKIKSATAVKRGDSIGAFVLFAGCKPNPEGVCNAEVDYEIYKPDGSLFAERKSQPLWDEQPPPAPNIQLGKAILAFQLGADDLEGEYKVKAKVTDRNANVSFELETKFLLK